jgi:methyl-accepting chemotaxis protein
MVFGNLKLTVKFIICGLAFSLPLAVMVYIILVGMTASALALFFMGFSAFIALLVLTLCILDSRQTAGSLKRLFRGLEANDLSLRLEAQSNDEFGELAAAVTRFLARLREAFDTFTHDANLVAGSVYDLSSSAKEITTTANQQSASVSEIVSTMESSKNLSEQMATKTAEVADLAVQTENLSRKGADLRDANQEMMEGIRTQNVKIISEIKNLADMIMRISEAIGIIDKIADQTKLIAFNASLEASADFQSDSGVAGARFSVVAAEIRRFADNVADSTADIMRKIEEVQTASQNLIAEANNGSKQIDQGYERMVAQKAVFENIVENSQNVAARSQQISNLSKQQEYASSQIFDTLKEISAGVKQFVTVTASTSRIADNLNGMSSGLRDTVAKYLTTE